MRNDNVFLVLNTRIQSNEKKSYIGPKANNDIFIWDEALMTMPTHCGKPEKRKWGNSLLDIASMLRFFPVIYTMLR